MKISFKEHFFLICVSRTSAGVLSLRVSHFDHRLVSKGATVKHKKIKYCTQRVTPYAKKSSHWQNFTLKLLQAGDWKNSRIQIKNFNVFYLPLTGISVNYPYVNFIFPIILFSFTVKQEPEQWCRYSDWLRAGRPRVAVRIPVAA
jgi:hypothetical protein